MEMEAESSAAAKDAGLLPAEAIEIELALDLQDASAETFEACVRHAVEIIGGEVLFDMPTDGSLEDASRIAALRVPGHARDRIVFAVLNDTETSIRVAEPDEVGDRLTGFAHAFVGVLSRIRDDASFGSKPDNAA